jgi:hypothetical protein
MTALILLAPGTPMLFQGQEFAAANPYLYFADHSPELAALVREGRCKFLSQFQSLKDHRNRLILADPSDPANLALDQPGGHLGDFHGGRIRLAWGRGGRYGADPSCKAHNKQAQAP